MLKSAISLLCLSCLTIACWFGIGHPAIALADSASLQSVSIAPAFTSELAMAKKSLFSFSGKRPTNLGVTDGKLAACPTTPNCVSSQAPDSDEQHKIVPLSYSAAPPEAMAALKSVIQGMERTEIVSESENYLYVEFTSALMGYVDDVEFWLDPAANVIHVRSASRLGQSDLGVNRKRVEEIRSKFTA
jgi:uncharacterized protein (DUF1499 family)